MAAAPKGGAVFSARVALDVGAACGLCVASGQREHGAWPGPVEDLPTYKGEVLLAMANMRTWPEYARHHGLRPRCNLLLRDPLARLVSLYLYARIGWERWFRDTGVSAELAAGTNVAASVALFWRRFGGAYLANSHTYLTESIAEGCRTWKMEDFAADYNGTAARMFAEGWGVEDPTALAEMVEIASEHDLGRRTEKQLLNDHHHTSSKVAGGLKREVQAALEGMPDVSALVREQRSALGY